jgi:small subunit ribosomal protein S9
VRRQSQVLRQRRLRVVARKKEATELPPEEVEAVEIDVASETEEEAAVTAAQATESAEEAETPAVPEAEGLTVEEVGVGEAVSVAAEPDRAQEVEPEEPVPPMEKPVRQGDVYYYGTGRRKTASAQVRLYPSKEPTITVNDLRVDEYFSREADVTFLKTPLRVTATEDMFRISVKVRGGGVSGQAGAVRHAIARALTKADPELRRTLRREGSLTRDPRMKERKKPGLKRARKAPQYTKR